MQEDKIVSRSNKRRTAERSRQGRMPFAARLGILITVLVLTVVAAGVLMAPGLNVAEVYCEGNVNVKTEDIMNTAQLQTGKNIFLTHIGKAGRNINKMPMVKDVKIQRVFPNRICISVEERAPLAYIPVNNEIIAIDAEKLVVKIENDNVVSKIIQAYTPKFDDEVQKDEENSSENKTSDDSTKDIEDTEGNSSNDEKGEQENQSDNGEQVTDVNIMNIPLISGIELSEATEGKKVKCGDEEKLDKLISICVALQNSGLLQKSTYLDVTDLMNIRLIIENRLDIMLGDANNIDYRAKFMAEVINNKISAYEVAILDYTGDDIYVRPREDGKQRVAEKKKTTNTSSSDDEENSENSKSKNNSSDESDETDEDTENEGNTTAVQSNGVRNIDDEE